MKINEFIQKTITTEDVIIFFRNGESIILNASRTRTSNDHCSILIKLGEQKIDFNTNLFGDDYEQVANKFITVLEAIIANPCELPKKED